MVDSENLSPAGKGLTDNHCIHSVRHRITVAATESCTDKYRGDKKFRNAVPPSGANM